ncbi:SRPBCC family protein [Pseudonocardia abyssalis]|uniref:SRPBCC family protein n=1 Tax=Pseudonocardia abyssalis TaxID=2792008 RepID=A0ABS6V1D2_9PSEU|nr:SRPBCC family protein [Pseudonocardia abyssalis]MBW0138197.1 SRPBCC family protein [Pseudonocardia abyssalis]
MDEVTTTVAAPPETVWALVTDITRMGEWSPENTGGTWTGGATGPAPGARFIGRNRKGWVRWSTRCRVVECAEPSRFAFTVAENRMTWGWRLEPADGGTRLTQWRDRTAPPNVAVRALVASGLLGRDREQLMVDGMHRTVAAVKAAAER